MGEHVSDQVSESTVSVSTEGDVVVVRLDDGKASALSHEIIDALSAALDQGASAKAVAIIGREGKFSAGFDLSVMTSGPQQAAICSGRAPTWRCRPTSARCRSCSA